MCDDRVLNFFFAFFAGSSRRLALRPALRLHLPLDLRVWLIFWGGGDRLVRRVCNATIRRTILRHIIRVRFTLSKTSWNSSSRTATVPASTASCSVSHLDVCIGCCCEIYLYIYGPIDVMGPNHAKKQPTRGTWRSCPAPPPVTMLGI